MRSLHQFALALALSTTLSQAHAYDERSVRNSTNQEIFKVRFYGIGDGNYSGQSEPESSAWNLDASQKNKILSAVGYWADILHPLPGLGPAILNVGTVEDVNAFGGSPQASIDDSTDQNTILYTLLNLQFNRENIPPDELEAGAHGLFVMGRLDYDTTLSNPPSVIPLTGRSEIEPIAYHEIAHGLGILSSISNTAGDFTPHFNKPLNVWDTFLRDDNGHGAQPGQAVLCQGCNTTYDPNAFDARKNQTYFEGPNVAQVLQGAMRGVPVSVYVFNPDGSFRGIDNDYMSHLELKNSLMSHQSYRNYTNFMEAELAVLQDLGYSIDRRQFYGRSVYGSGLSLVNTQGYFARNASGTAYLPGYYNTAQRGIGLHVYGSDNTITQAADILTQGAGAVGIRVDGENNNIVVAPSTRIHSNGYYGQGLLFAYGKNHTLVQRGTVQALGTGGVGLRFDFGQNALGQLAADTRGSYIFKQRGVDQPLLDELNGPLVSRADITGSIAGKRAAIYISGNALVGSINFMQGARIQGDIVSDYNQQDGMGNQRLTRLSFGQKTDAQGRDRHRRPWL
jgi:hypothetical protein